MRQKTLTFFSLTIVVLVVALIVPNFIYGGAHPVSLKKDPLDAAAAASLVNQSSGYQPLEGKDYVISDVSDFEGGQWVVVSVKPLGSAVDPGKVVFEKTSSGYEQVLGPGNFFQSGDLSGLPSDVSDFLLPGGQK